MLLAEPIQIELRPQHIQGRDMLGGRVIVATSDHGYGPKRRNHDGPTVLCKELPDEGKEVLGVVPCATSQTQPMRARPQSQLAGKSQAPVGDSNNVGSLCLAAA